jgi:hypothetical protein
LPYAIACFVYLQFCTQLQKERDKFSHDALSWTICHKRAFLLSRNFTAKMGKASHTHFKCEWVCVQLYLTNSQMKMVIVVEFALNLRKMLSRINFMLFSFNFYKN